jgi:predicted permease
MIITTILFAASIVAVSILAWLFRQRFIKHLPSKETMGTVCLVAPIVLLLVMAILPDILLLIGTLALMPPTIRTIIGIAAATAVIYGGCKKADAPKPQPIHWRAPDTGYTAETVPASPPDNKEGP